MARGEGQKVLDGAAGGPAIGDEPRWASFDYLELRRTLEEIVSAMAAATQIEGSLAAEPQAGSKLRLVVTNADPDRAEASASDPPAYR